MAALVLATGACATTPTIVDPTWAQLPAPEELGEAYPRFATMIGIHGVAEVQCAGLPDGRLTRCVSNWAVPTGLGFDRAALSLTPSFRLEPRTVNGEASKSEVRFRVNFSLPPEEVDDARYEGAEPEPSEIALARPLAEQMYDFYLWTAEEEDGDLDVNADRQTAVLRMVADLRAERREQEVDAMARGLARVLTPEQITAMIEGRRPDPAPPPYEAFELASRSDDAETVESFETRLREKYCALYSCDSKGPPR